MSLESSKTLLHDDQMSERLVTVAKVQQASLDKIQRIQWASEQQMFDGAEVMSEYGRECGSAPVSVYVIVHKNDRTGRCESSAGCGESAYRTGQFV